MPVEIKELVVRVEVVAEKKNKSDANIDAKLQKLKSDILKSCKKMIGGKDNGRR